MFGRFFSWLRWAWRELVATWQDAQDCGDWPGHVIALAGVLIGAIASSAGGGALGYREAFGTIAALVAVMVLASVGLANRRATAS